ncbi:MAG: MerR family transcriptional regulator [Acidobacteria bacterium]|nr:MerR family transcriptional regulator [Acidobacteriota bacterium]
MTTTETLKIGAVVDALAEEFPDVSVSKIRFLESERLIHPPRTASGYRQFGSADVDRIRYILRQQRDHFLPLKVIREKLSEWERGVEPTSAPRGGPPPETYFATTTVRLDRDQLAQTAGVPAGLVKDLLGHGVLKPDIDDLGVETFGDDAVAIAHAAQRLVSHGLEARHLRSIRTAANREVDLFRQLTGPLLRHANPTSIQRGAEVLADVAQAARELQEAMVRSELRALLGR